MSTDTNKTYPTPKSFRFDPETTNMLDALKKKLGVSQADVVRLGVRKLHESVFSSSVEPAIK